MTVSAQTLSPALSQGRGTSELVSDTVLVNGVRLHYVAAGSGPLMVFLHGFPEFWYEWRHQLPEFAADHTVVAPDLRGFNLSDKPAELAAYRMSVVAEDIRQLIGALGHRKATLVAHDWGGSVAWYLAARHPEVIERLVIVNAPHPATFARELAANPAQRAASAYFAPLVSPGIEEKLIANDYQWLVDTFARRAPAGLPLDAATLARYREAWGRPGAITGGLNYYRVSTLTRQSREAAAVPAAAGMKVTVPTLVVWGMSDVALLPGMLEGLEEFVPDLTIERIPEGTHWVVHEFPTRVNGAIRGFLGR
jgi:pimeloyl-ACP methyl ester carboxylesterase